MEDEDEVPQLVTNGHAEEDERMEDADAIDVEDGLGEDDDDIPLSELSDLSSTAKEDIIPHQRLTINNTAALLKSLRSFALPLSTMAFSEHQSLTSEEPVSIADIDDDLNRELAFYKQSLDAVTQARKLLKAEDVPFSRPTDYFAEMAKTDEHMGRIKQKLVDEAAGKKAAAEARKLRDLKKFGKQVQVAKLQERDRAKRDTLDKIQMLKKSKSVASVLFFLASLSAAPLSALVCVQTGRVTLTIHQRGKTHRHQRQCMRTKTTTCSTSGSSAKTAARRGLTADRTPTAPDGEGANDQAAPNARSAIRNSASAARNASPRAATPCRAAISAASTRHLVIDGLAVVVPVQDPRKRSRW